MASMFWGLRMEPGKRYSTTVDKSFHISMATLDTTSVPNDGEVVSVLLDESGGGGVFLLTNLRRRDHLSTHLDLNFITGDKITLFCRGQGTVHLSGYMVLDDEDDISASMLDEEVDDEEDDEVEDEDEDETQFNALAKGMPGKKQMVDKKRKPEELVKNKKAKKKKMESTGSEDESEDESDDDGDLLKSLSQSEFSEDDDIEMDDEEEEDEEDEEEEEEEEVKPVQKKKNKQQQEKEQKKQGKQNKQQPSPTKTPNGTVAGQKTPQSSGKKEKKGAESPGKETTPKGTVRQDSVPKPLTGGVNIKDIRVGNGPPAKHGKHVVVYYTGRLKTNGKVFDSVMQGSGFKFRLGHGEVIKGWDIGVMGMRVGGKRLITCPPQAAYGQKGAPPQIPPNSTLTFEVELKGVN